MAIAFIVDVGSPSCVKTSMREASRWMADSPNTLCSKFILNRGVGHGIPTRGSVSKRNFTRSRT